MNEVLVYPIAIDGLSDHVHILIKYKSSASVADVVKHIKGKSAFLLNKHAILPIPFKWSKGYFVASVSPGDIQRITRYILDQKKTARAEYQEWVARHFGQPLNET
jgi:REP element-mobilizing transposase RayT